MVVLTTVQITNDTGKDMRPGPYYNYCGHVKPDPPQRPPYPPQIVRGATVNLVFENPAGDEVSGAVVYQGENEKGNQFQWLFAWYSKKGLLTYKAYTEIAEANHKWNWNEVSDKLMNSVPISHAKYENCVSDAIIIQPLFHVIYQGRMSLKGGAST